MNLYEDFENTYACHQFKTRNEWLLKRIHGIGGSDASILIGLNPYKTTTRLWDEKKGFVKPEELSNKAIEHGNALEPVLRAWFKASCPEYDVQYQGNAILQSQANKWRLYSPDGLLFHEELGKGILEIKTTLIQNANMLQDWNNKIPKHYYVQVLHGLLTTNFDYVVVVAELRFAWDEDKVEIRKYFIDRNDIEDDLRWVDQQETYNWNEYYVKNKGHQQHCFYRRLFMDQEDKEYQLSECKDLLLLAKESLKGIYEYQDLVSYIDIALDEERRLEGE